MKQLFIITALLFFTGCYTQYETTYKTTVTEEKTVVDTETNDTTVTINTYTIDLPYLQSQSWPYDVYWNFSWPYWRFYGWMYHPYNYPYYYAHRYPKVFVAPPKYVPRRLPPVIQKREPIHRNFGGVRPYTLPQPRQHIQFDSGRISNPTSNHYRREADKPAPRQNNSNPRGGSRR